MEQGDFPLPAVAGDSVSSMLQRLRVHSWVAGLSTAGGRWRVPLPPGPGGFHAVLDGRMLMMIEGATHELRAGDVAIVVGGGRHFVGDHPESPLIDMRRMIDKEMVRRHAGLHLGEGEPTVRFFGGMIVFDGPGGPRLRSALPPVMIMRASEEPPHALVPSVIRLLAHQVGDAAPGTHAVMTHLVTILFVEAVRRALNARTARGAATGGWAQAVLDEHIGPALAMLHASPGRAWSLADMANEAGLSRTVFHERFTALVGAPPASYLRQHRLELAADLLRHSDMALRDIASRAGYSTQGAFCSAFRKWSGAAPGEFRERAAAIRAATAL